MRRLVVFVVAVLLGSVVLPATAAGAQVEPAAAEAEFVAEINALRRTKGLGELTVHPELVSVGRSWAATMARQDRISHNAALADAVKADWQKLGENVGVGMTVEKLHEAFVASPAHYKNLVDPVFTHIGVGVVLGRDGAIFTSHQFMKLRPAAAAAATEAATPVPTPAAVTTSAVRPPARLVLVLQQLRALDAA